MILASFVMSARELTGKRAAEQGNAQNSPVPFFDLVMVMATKIRFNPTLTKHGNTPIA
jgi:hypothetical protein